MNSKPLFPKFLILAGLAFGISSAQSVTDDEDMIVTSKPHRLPRLLTLQTSEVLESYGIGFAGSGNIHSIINGSHDALNGAVYIGLGDVAELGYDMEQVRMFDNKSDKRMKGHIKIQPVSEGKWMPAIAVTYGTNLDNNVELGSEVPFGLERQSWLLGASKSFQMGSYRVSVHPGVSMQVDKLIKSSGVSVDTLGIHENRLGAQFGATWQTADNTMFIFESRVVHLLDQAAAHDQQALSYQYGFENNLGVRFYLRNWLFLDAGIMSLYDSGASTWDTGIHANVTGLIPLKSIGERIFGSVK